MKKENYRILKGEYHSHMVDLEESIEDLEIISKAQKEYLPWDKFRNKNLDSEYVKKVLWSKIKMKRESSNEASLILDKDKKPFKFNSRINSQFLHILDKEYGSQLMLIEGLTNKDKIDLERRIIIDESIASSQFEGARTTRLIAKKMIENNRKPTNRDEQMIMNNHKAMSLIESELKQEDLTLGLLKDLHKTITYKTINEDHYGKFRDTFDRKGNRLVIEDENEKTVYFVTPDKDFVISQLPRFIKFFNDETEEDFIHPIIKGIMIHFWLAYLHPFEDGNGRLARILFYWYLIKKGYWVFSYLSISKMIKNSPKQYLKSFIYSEQDDNDLNYFIHYNLKKIEQSREELVKYILDYQEKKKSLSKLRKEGLDYEESQLTLLRVFFDLEIDSINIKEYMRRFNFKKNAAIMHLKRLVDDGLLEKVKSGRNTFYYPTDNIKKLFE